MLENEKASMKESEYGKNEVFIDALRYIYASNMIKKAMREYISSSLIDFYKPRCPRKGDL